MVKPQKALFWLFFVYLLGGCQTPDTEILEQDGSLPRQAFENVEFAEDMDVDLTKAVIIDARSRFKYELSKTPRSVHFYWKDWRLFKYRGADLEKVKYDMQRRLARLGIDPYTQVVIFGEGAKGDGQEYYIAAVLFALGIEKIKVTSPKTFSKVLVSRDVGPLANLPYWERPIRYNFSCAGREPGKTIGPFPQKTFITESYQVDLEKLEKRLSRQTLNGVRKGSELFAYGLALESLRQGYPTCVVAAS